MDERAWTAVGIWVFIALSRALIEVALRCNVSRRACVLIPALLGWPIFLTLMLTVSYPGAVWSAVTCTLLSPLLVYGPWYAPWKRRHTERP